MTTNSESFVKEIQIPLQNKLYFPSYYRKMTFFVVFITEGS